MSISALSLPIDIPWKRLAISEDMYASSPNGLLPEEWRSSCAVFSYDPTPDQEPANPDEISTFLKVVVSVTGYQPSGKDVDAGVLRGSYGTAVIQNYETITAKYYGAYGALLQVAVFPFGGEWTIEQYPYLTDFEPKKREVVETVTDTGEALTQSSTDLNVRKGTTSTDSTEADNIDRGGSFGFNVSTPYGGGGVTSSTNKQVGTTAQLGTQAIDVISTDASREKRESYSHTTNLSQLYHALDSYHAGTNRAIFFLNARPHIVDSPFTFANGPRLLEGIQEFFLVVRRPKLMEQFCVRAVLETAHIYESDVQVTTGSTVYDQEQLSQTFTLHANGGSFSADNTPGQWTINIPGGFKLDRTRGGGPYHVDWGGGNVDDGTKPAGVDWSLSGNTDSGHTAEAIPQITPYDDHIDIRAHIYGIQNVFSPQDANMSYTFTVFTISIDPIQTPQTTTEKNVDLFLTAREVSSCQLEIPIFKGTYISYEKEAAVSLKANLAAARGQGRDAAAASNAVGRDLKREVIASFRSNKRYAPGAVTFETTRFAMRDIFSGNVILNSPPMTRLLADAVPEEYRQKIVETAPKLTVAQAIAAGPSVLSSQLNFTNAEVTEILRAATGLSFGGNVQRAAGDGGKSAETKDGGSARQD
jgi:hypothetical protein